MTPRLLPAPEPLPVAFLPDASGLSLSPKVRHLADYAEHALLPAVEGRFLGALHAQDAQAAVALLYGLSRRATPAPRCLLERCGRLLFASLLGAAPIRGERSEDHSRSPDR